MIQYQRIQNALESLGNSTHRAVELRNETFVFNGLCSPYVSHQDCRVENGHGIPGTILFDNTRYALIVTQANRWVEFTPGRKDFKSPWRKLPAHLIAPLFQFPATLPSWLTGTVWVMVPDRFMCFDDDGKPVFRPCCSITAKWSDGMDENGTNQKVLYKEDFSEKIDEKTGLRLFEGRLWTFRGDPLPMDCVTPVACEPSDEFDAAVPTSVGMFHQCSRWGGNCPLEEDKCPPQDCPDTCGGKTKRWHFHPAIEGD